MPKLCMLAVLTLVTVIIYWPVRHYGFIGYDDPAYLVDIPFIQNGVNAASVKAAFTHPYFGNYAPVLYVCYCLDQTLFDLRPGAMHLENVAFHLINGVLLWRLLSIATGETYKSFAIALLFLCHPTQVESVCWIADRKDVLCTAFLLGSMLAYMSYCQKLNLANRSWLLNYLGMIALFILSLLTKSMGATLPAVLLLMDVWPLKRWPQRNWVLLGIEKIPLVMLSIVAVVISHYSLKVGGGLGMLPWLTATDRIENAIVCYAIYLEKECVPINLAIYYPHPGARPLISVFAAAGLLIVLTILAWQVRRRRPYILIGWLWFIGCLLPVIQLVQIGPHAMADRYAYFPSIGFFVAFVWSIAAFARRWTPVIMFVLLACFSVMSYHQAGYWTDTKAMFTHVLEVTPDSPLPHDELAGDALEKNDLRTAIEEYQHALDLAPDPLACDGLGNCYLQIDYSKSVFYFQRATQLLHGSWHFETDLAKALRMRGDFAEARKHLEIALKLKPDYLPAQAELSALGSHH